MQCRWPGTVLPVVKFVNGREEVLLPELFTADVAAVGICKRLQVQAVFWAPENTTVECFNVRSDLLAS